MRKHLFAAMLLMAGVPLTGTFNAAAEPAPQQQSQNATVIEGTVLDENNEPVVGASVVQKGVKGGVSTDADGNFKIRVKRGTRLEVSYVGYATQTVSAAPNMVVYLQPSTELLNELVAIGYGTQKRANLTGAVTTVDVERTIGSRPQPDVLKALQGAVPGLTILNNTGNITANATVQLRGRGTLSATVSPLFVVDGATMDDISYLNPEDIKDISVLKDASSSSIYGTRAAFGVILITTKGGEKSNKVQVKYSNNFAWSQATCLPEINDNVSSLEAMIEAAKMTGAANGEFFGMYYTDILPYAKKWQEQNKGKITTYREARPYVDENNVGDYYVNEQGMGFLPYADYDINKIFLNNAAPSNTHNVSINGTSGKTTFNVGFGYNKRQSLLNFNPETVTRYNARADISIDVNKWVKAGVRFNYTQRETVTNNVGSNIWGTIWRFPGFYQMLGYRYDEEGTAWDFQNEIAYLRQSAPIPVSNALTRMQAWVRAEIIKGLSLNAEFTYTIHNNNCSYAYLPVKSWQSWGRNLSAVNYRVNPVNTTSTKDNTHNWRWNMNIYGTYEFKVAQDHNFKLMLGAQAEKARNSYFQARTKVPLDFDLPALNLYTGDLVAPVSSDSHWATAGFFGRFNYDYKGKYLLEYNGRYDGSSRFPASGQWAYFQSGSIGWRFTEEAFLESTRNWLSNGKLRASYGEIGNQAVGTDRFISTIGTSNLSYIDPSTGVLYNVAGMPTIVAPSLTWERIRTTDVGLDFGFLDNSIYGSFDWFQRDTKDMLAPGSTLPATLGAKAPYGNQGGLRTRGWEISLGYNKSFGEFDVYATFNLANSSTTVTKWTNITNSLSDNYSGKEYGAIYGFITDRYFTKDDFQQDASGNLLINEKGQFIFKEGIADQHGLESGSFHYGPGDIKYKDLDGDGVISGGDGTVENHGDVVKIGNELPRFEYGFHIGGAWRGIDLDIFCQGVGKREMWTVSSMVVPFTQAPNDIYYKGMESHNSVVFDDKWNVIDWVVDQSNTYPRLWPNSYGSNNVPGVGGGQNNYLPQDRYLQDMSYLRVKNITIGYTLPAAWTQKALIQNARIYVSGENLFFIHRGNKAFDPEIVTTEWSGANTIGRTNPIQRSYSFGIQVTL